MADAVNEIMEAMVPELEDLQRTGLFSAAEVKSIVAKRRAFEYDMRRTVLKKADVLRYVQYEVALEQLRRKRKRRKGVTRRVGPSEYAGVRRVHYIFNRALKKFKSDERMWMQYIDFCMKSGARRSLGKVFARALQILPRNARLWILAARTELDYNRNVTASRILFQRAIRLNAGAPEIWHEYFRMELAYVEMMRERAKVLNVTHGQPAKGESKKRKRDESSSEDEDEQSSSAADVDSDEEGSAGIHVPLVEGEEEAAEDDEAQPSVADSVMDGFLDGAIPFTVYRHAASKFPHDVDFSLRFIEIADATGGFEKLVEKIYASIKADAGDDDERVAAVLAERDASSAVKAYQAALKRIGTARMAELFAAYLKRTGNSKRTVALFDTICAAGEKPTRACLSACLAAVAGRAPADKVAAMAAAACEHYPAHAPFWRMRVELADEAERDELIEDALRAVGSPCAADVRPDVLELWALRFETTPELLAEWATVAKCLRQLSHEASMAQQIQAQVLDHALEHGGAPAVLAMYERFCQLPFPTLALYEHTLAAVAGDKSVSAGQRQRILESAVNRHGDDGDAWMLYVRSLVAEDNFARLAAVYDRACRTLAPAAAEAFVNRYRAVVG